MNIIRVAALILFGLFVLVNPDIYWHAYGVGVNLTDVKWIIGPLLIVAGVYFYREGKKQKKIEEDIAKTQTNLICPKCKQAYPVEAKRNLEQCPKCKIRLLTLDEFLKFINK